MASRVLLTREALYIKWNSQEAQIIHHENVTLSNWIYVSHKLCLVSLGYTLSGCIKPLGLIALVHIKKKKKVMMFRMVNNSRWKKFKAHSRCCSQSWSQWVADEWVSPIHLCHFIHEFSRSQGIWQEENGGGSIPGISRPKWTLQQQQVCVTATSVLWSNFLISLQFCCLPAPFAANFVARINSYSILSSPSSTHEDKKKNSSHLIHFPCPALWTHLLMFLSHRFC